MILMRIRMRMMIPIQDDDDDNDDNIEPQRPSSAQRTTTPFNNTEPPHKHQHHHQQHSPHLAARHVHTDSPWGREHVAEAILNDRASKEAKTLQSQESNRQQHTGTIQDIRGHKHIQNTQRDQPRSSACSGLRAQGLQLQGSAATPAMKSIIQ